MRNLFLALAATAAFVAPAQANVVLFDDFNSETLGLNAPLNNWNVTGNIDIVGASNPYGITASSTVVDLDGTSGPGGITSKNSYAFHAGDKITLTFDLSGSQRSTNFDPYDVGFLFGSPTDILGIAAGGAYGYIYGGNFLGYTDIHLSTGINGAVGPQPFDTYSIYFTAGSAGTLQPYFYTSSKDNIGPLLDNVSLDIAGVPEPANWAMMIAGFGMIGGAMRQRRSKAVMAAA